MALGWRLHGELKEMMLRARVIGDLSQLFEKPGRRKPVEADRKTVWPDGKEVRV